MEFIFLTKLRAECLQRYQKYAPLQVFSFFLLRFVVTYKEFLEILRISVYIAKPGQAVYFTFRRGVFRTLSNV